MLAHQQQWCPRCKRYVETEQKQNKLGRRSNLMKLITTCQKCRTTLSIPQNSYNPSLPMKSGQNRLLIN